VSSRLGSGKFLKRHDFGRIYPDLAIEGPDSALAGGNNSKHMCCILFRCRLTTAQGSTLRSRTTYRSLSKRMKFVVDLLSSGRHPAKILPAGEEVFKPAVVTHDPVNYPPSTTDDLSRQQHDEMQETTELHPE
jgi:hypothetical protein